MNKSCSVSFNFQLSTSYKLPIYDVKIYDDENLTISLQVNYQNIGRLTLVSILKHPLGQRFRL